jgi:hypothetical protein
MPLELIDDRRASDKIGLVTCPNCYGLMRPVFIKPVDGEEGLREAAYRCPRCEAETRRWISP